MQRAITKNQKTNMTSPNQMFELYNLWQFGDWKSLAQIETNNANEEQIALKASAQLQLGAVQQAKDTLKELSTPLTEKTARLLISGVLNTIGKAKAILNQQHQSEAYFVDSIQLIQTKQTSTLIYKARIQEQYNQLNLIYPYIKQNAEPAINIKSYKLEQTESQHFNQDLTITFWLKIHNWPTSWTNIVSKTQDDEHNEFCLRLKNENQGQWYYGDNDKAIVLNSWTPKKHIRCNEWAYIAVTKQQNQLSRIYIDGLIHSSRDIQGLPVAKNNDECIELMGQHKTNVNLVGVILNFKLHNAAMTTEQIVQSMLPDNNKNATSISYDYYSSRQQIFSVLEQLDFQHIQQQKYNVAKKFRGLDYHELIDTLKNQQPINIVVIGANDGKNNDPIYDYVYQNNQTTQVVLIEPQQTLLPYLEKNYAFHPNVHIINCAIGDANQLTLYSVKPEYWPQLNVPYAQDRGWPIYRAPTGVSSSDRQHVTDWLNKHLDIPNPADAIEKFYVPCKTLCNLLQEQNLDHTIDVLQVDTEGFDDYVLYNSDLTRTQPKIIHFESAHLEKTRKNDLYGYLKQHNYQVFEIEEDSLALINTHNWSFKNR